MMSYSDCYIIGAGDFSTKYFTPSNNDLIICADGGYDKIDTQKYNVSYIVGDNDSIIKDKINIPSINYKVEKDETDMDLAVRKAIDLGYTSIKLFGAYGSRPDHFIANIQLMSRCIKNKIHITLCAENFIGMCIHNEGLNFSCTSNNEIISIFSLDDISYDVSISGLKYTVKNITLKNQFALGVSNHTIGKSANIIVKNGTLLVLSYDYIANTNYNFFSEL